jgi:pyruvate ferredoxin oxidoreductase alpha subunit
MTEKLLTGNAAIAWGARLAQVDYVPAFPITPQTEIIETLARWMASREMTGRLVTLESEHSMLTAAGAAAATGVRVFTATSSQGLLYGMEMLYTVAGWRAPFVLTNVSRGLASPITLEPDHNDILAARDSGFLQIHCSTCQEALDSVLLAYRLAEDRRVRLPVLVNIDGFYLSFTREPVAVPSPQEVDLFLPPFDPGSNRFRAGAPSSQAVAVLGSGAYSYFRYEAQLAATNALTVYDEVAGQFETVFGRNHPAIEGYRTTDAEVVFVMMGSFATKAKEAVDRLREQGRPVGLVRVRLLRPFPNEDLVSLLSGKKGVAVIDQNISVGFGGILHGEVAAALYGRANAPGTLASFIGALGGGEIFRRRNFTKSPR